MSEGTESEKTQKPLTLNFICTALKCMRDGKCIQEGLTSANVCPFLEATPTDEKQPEKSSNLLERLIKVQDIQQQQINQVTQLFQSLLQSLEVKEK
jgi:hypothetical protein